jgi:hypothetical protein
MSTSESLQSLPLAMSRIVNDTFRGVLAEFFLETRALGSFWRKDPVELLCNSLPITSTKSCNQHTIARRYLRAVGRVTVQAITTTFHTIFENRSCTSTATQIYVEIYPNPGLIRLGVYRSFVQHGFARFRQTQCPSYELIMSSTQMHLLLEHVSQEAYQLFNASLPIAKPRLLIEYGERKACLDLVLFRILQLAETSHTYLEIMLPY